MFVTSEVMGTGRPMERGARGVLLQVLLFHCLVGVRGFVDCELFLSGSLTCSRRSALHVAMQTSCFLTRSFILFIL